MALVERLAGWMSDGTEPSGTQNPNKIHVHDFFAACHEIVAGGMTVAQVKALFSMSSSADASGKSDTQDMDALVALAPALDGARAMYINRIHSVFILAEKRYGNGYNTPAGVRAKLGIT